MSELDHKAAILDLFTRGFHPIDIRDQMVQSGYFQGKSKNQSLAFIHSVLRRKPAQAIAASRPKPPSRMDEMLRLLEPPKKRYSL